MTRQPKLVSRGFYIKWRKVSTFSMISLTSKFEGDLLDRGLKLGWGGFRLRDASLSRKRCEIQLR